MTAPPINNKLMTDAVANLFMTIAQAIMDILGYGWQAGIDFVDAFAGITHSGGPWVLLIVLVMVLTGYHLMTNYR